MSSGSCLVCFIFLAIIILIYFAPSFIFTFAPEISSEILMVAVFVIFVTALCFITQAVIDDDDDDEDVPTSGGETTRIVERETVLVVCPYCGNKNQQGLSKCQNCDGDL
jgi:L-asparagine transporter-like permease